jgi:hypothetical protein
MRWSPLAILTVLSAGCFSPEVPADTDGGPGGTDSGETESSSATATQTGPSTSMGPGGTDSSDPTTDTDTESADETGPGSDDPPVFEAFEVNGSTTPEDVMESSMVVLSATVSDDVGVASVAFFEGEELLGTVTEEPFELEVLVTSADNGGFLFTAVATDTADQEAVSDEVQLVAGISGGEVLDVNEGLFEGEQAFGVFGGLGAVAPDRLVLAGASSVSDIDNPLSHIVTVDGSVNQLNSTTVPLNAPSVPRRFEGGLALIPAVRIDGSQSTMNGIEILTTWRYEVFDPALGETLPAAALQFPGGNNVGGAHVVEVLGSGFALATGPGSLTAYESDLDIDIWEDDLGVASGEPGYVFASVPLPDGSVVVSVLAPEGCQGSVATSCLRKINAEGTAEWTIGLQATPLPNALAWDSGDGVYYSERVDDGLLIGHVDTNGEEQASTLLTFANPLSTLGAQAVSDRQGGVVLAFATGQQENNGNIAGEVGTVLRLDPGLRELWRVNGFGPGSRPVAAVSVEAGQLYVAGIEPTDDPPTAFGTAGDVWLGRANL